MRKNRNNPRRLRLCLLSMPPMNHPTKPRRLINMQKAQLLRHLIAQEPAQRLPTLLHIELQQILSRDKRPNKPALGLQASTAIRLEVIVVQNCVKPLEQPESPPIGHEEDDGQSAQKARSPQIVRPLQRVRHRPAESNRRSGNVQGMCVAACVAGERAHLCHFSSSLVVKTTFASGYARTSSSAKNAPGMSVTAWSLLADS
jgi:hypothetical protein